MPSMRECSVNPRPPCFWPAGWAFELGLSAVCISKARSAGLVFAVVADTIAIQGTLPLNKLLVVVTNHAVEAHKSFLHGTSVVSGAPYLLPVSSCHCDPRVNLLTRRFSTLQAQCLFFHFYGLPRRLVVVCCLRAPIYNLLHIPKVLEDGTVLRCALSRFSNITLRC